MAGTPKADVRTEAVRERLPAGSYRIDPVHSSARFRIEHSGFVPFHGSFRDVAGSLEVGDDGSIRLAGAVKAESVDVDDPDLRGHLLSPEFFDAERHPEIRFASSELALDGDDLRLEGKLEVKGNRSPIEARGKLRGPRPDLDGRDRLALELEAVVDRHRFGLDWQAELPGGGEVLGHHVTLNVVLQLVAE
jgi:polyisoprenoid-binding protein YceI